ncbi:MAG: hypothetical protein AAFO82_15955, partial [Bacteroidota bacterium]
MQIYKTISDKEEHKKFLARYGKYYGLITAGILLAQILSALTESGLIYSNVADATLVFGENTSRIAGIIGAIIGVALIEIVGLRVALTGAVDAFLYKRWKGLDALFSIALIILTVVLVPSSFILSLKGGSQIVDNLKEKKELQEKAAIDESESLEIAELDTTYTRNIAAINETYKGLIDSEETKAEADKKVKQQNYKHWLSKGDTYKTRINNALVELQAVEAAKTARIAELKEKQASELKDLQTRYNRDKDAILNESKMSIAATTGRIDDKAATFKTGTKFIVIIALFFAVGFTVIQRIYLKGSGIEELAEPSNFFFSPSLISERMKLAQDKYQIARRNRIASRRNNLPTITPYVSQLPIHDLGQLQRSILQLQMSNSDQRQIYYLDTGQFASPQPLPVAQTDISNEELENRIKSLTQAQMQAEGQNHHEAAKVVELQAKEVIKMYLQRNGMTTNDDEIAAFQGKVISHLNEPKNYANPFDTDDEKQRNTIGFKQQKNGQSNTGNNNPVSNGQNTGKTDTQITGKTEV